jgi:hypothetical protein
LGMCSPNRNPNHPTHGPVRFGPCLARNFPTQQCGAPGAADILQNTGRTVLYEPRGAVGTGKSVTRFTSEGVPIQEGLPQGNATLFGRSIPRDWCFGTAARGTRAREIAGDGSSRMENPRAIL